MRPLFLKLANRQKFIENAMFDKKCSILTEEQTDHFTFDIISFCDI